MKHLVVVIAIFLFGSTHAQRMKLGFRSGFSFSNFYSHNYSGNQITTNNIQTGNAGSIQPGTLMLLKPYYETHFLKDMRVGFFSGFTMEWELKKKLGVEIGLNYCQKGINLDYSLNASSVNADNSITKLSYQFNRDLRLDYLTIPVVFKYKIGKKERLYILAGVYNAVALSFKIKNSTMTTNEEVLAPSGQQQTQAVSASSLTKAYAGIFDSGLVGGFGIAWPLGDNFFIGIDIRTAVGLTSVPRKYEETGFQSFSDRTKNISIETGLKVTYSVK
jgi:hypothetical protein